MKKILLILMTLSFFFVHSVYSDTRARTALIIGNSHYEIGLLNNPVNDANDMAAKLKELGFEVILKLDANKREMKDAVRLFDSKLRDKKGVGLFYYAGHGMQVDGINYLIPIDADIKQSYDVSEESLAANYVLEAMEIADNDLNIIILDACRDNPFARGWRSARRGLAKMEASTGSLVAYATAPGKSASDGTDRNGLYTKHLLQNMSIPGLSIEEVFKNVRIGVTQETNELQVPWEESSLIGDFYFLQNSDAKVDKKLPESSSVATEQVASKEQNSTFSTESYRATAINFRHKPETLSSNEIKILLAKHGFYDKRWNPGGKGVTHQYQVQVKENAIILFDVATGLMWQKGGSSSPVTFENAQQYVRDINNDNFGGFNDWRLPTVEEAMSLMEPQAHEDLHISSEFERGINFIWTSDKASDERIWMLYFYDGMLGLEKDEFNAWVRVVRR